MADVKGAWNDAGEQLSGLGKTLKAHYDQQRGEDREQVRAEVRDALKRLAEAVQDAFEAMGAAAKDQAVKDNVRHVGQSVTAALGATFQEISEELRKRARRPGDEPPGGEGAEPPSGQSGGQEGGQEGGQAGGQAGGSGESGTSQKDDDSPGVEPWGTP